jgi:uncharacterized protein YraI
MSLVANFFLAMVRMRRNAGASVGSLAVNDSKVHSGPSDWWSACSKAAVGNYDEGQP